MAYNDKGDRAGLRGYVQFNTGKYKYTHTHAHAHAHTHTKIFVISYH